LSAPALLLLLALLALVAAPRPVAAHAFLDESDPAANAILPNAPTTATLRFTEPLERSYSQAALHDETGAVVEGVSSRFDEGDAYVLLVDLPPNLPNGTYSVLWQTLSAADGHTAQGYVPFTVGTAADVAPVAPPVAPAATSGPPLWLQAVGRWLSLLGVAAFVAVWPVWLFVLRPAIAPAWQLGPGLTRRVRAFTVGAVAVAVGGSVLALVVQALTVGGGGDGIAAVRATLAETRFGDLWLLRVGLILVYAAALLAVAWWWPWRRRGVALFTLLLGALLPLPFSLLSHAAAQPEGAATAVAADALHLLAAAVWGGGLLVLVAALAPTLRDLTPAGRRVVLSRAIPRFSLLALIAWGVMALTGFYAGWLQVGNLTALRETAYGQSLTIKLALMVPLLALAAFNLLVVTRRLRTAAADPAVDAWSWRFTTAIAAEATLVVLVFFVVGRLTAQAPAREALAQESGRVVVAFQDDGQIATLSLTPGGVGPNHYRLELGSGHDHGAGPGAPPVEAVLRVELDSPEAETGQKEIRLTQAAGGAFEGHGSEFSIAGNWEIEAIVRQEGQRDWRATATQPITADGAAAELPGPPPRFGENGVVGLLLLVAGIAGVVFALQGGGGGRIAFRKESAGLGAAGLALGLVLLLQAQVPAGQAAAGAVAALPADDPAVVRGAALFAANCVACHGPAGTGDGPAATGLERPPADLTAPHALVHRDEDIAYWIANGIPGSGMPAFAGQLSQEEIGDIVAYVRTLQAGNAPPGALLAAGVPGPEECRTAPRSLDDLRRLGSGGVAGPAASPRAVDPAAGQPADPATVEALTATARELVACSNAGDALRRLALFSDANVRAAYPQGPTQTLEIMAATPLAVPEAERVALLSVAAVRLLPDGRASAVVGIDNPGAHSHGPPPGASPVAGAATPAPPAGHDTATLVFVREGDRWLIDEVRRTVPG